MLVSRIQAALGSTPVNTLSPGKSIMMFQIANNSLDSLDQCQICDDF
jgi:hypothetical protein